MRAFGRRVLFHHEFHRVTRYGFWLLSMTALLTPAGCQLGRGRIVDSPLSFDEQSDAILKIVPPGTPRAEAIHKLEQAGIEGTSLAHRSIFYCDVWNRKDGTRWQLNVALLFDEHGQLYKTRRSEADTGIYIPDDNHPDSAKSTDTASQSK